MYKVSEAEKYEGYTLFYKVPKTGIQRYPVIT